MNTHTHTHDNKNLILRDQNKYLCFVFEQTVTDVQEDLIWSMFTDRVLEQGKELCIYRGIFWRIEAVA
jgi:hypothetical protein